MMRMKENSNLTLRRGHNYSWYLSIVIIFCNAAVLAQQPPVGSERIFRAGAATSNITPKIGTSMNGSMQDKKITAIHDETYARCIVLDDGDTRLAIVVSDLCIEVRMMY